MSLYKNFIRNIVIISSITIQYGSGNLHNQNTNSSNVALSECAAIIVKNIVNSNDNSVVDMTIINLNNSLVLRKINEIDGIRLVTRSLLPPNRTLYTQICLLTFRHFADLKYGIEKSRKDSLWNPKANFVIIFTKFIDNDINDVFYFLMDKFMFRVTVIARFRKDTDYHIFTCTPDWNEVCVGSLTGTIKISGSCSDLDDESKIVQAKFPIKLKGCYMEMITHRYSPFVIFPDGKEDMYGIDEYLLNLLSEVEGFKFKLVDSGVIEDFGRVLDNYTYTGMLQYIEDSSVVGAVGGYILSWKRSRGLDFLYPYIVDQISVVIPRAPIFNKWSAVATELSYITSALIVLVFIIFCIMVIKFSVFVKDRNDKIRDILLVWGIFFCIVDIKYIRNVLSSRLIALNMYFFVILIYCVIQASLLRESTSPKRAYQMNEMEEVFASNYELILSPAMSNYLKSLNDEKISMLIDERSDKCKSTLDCLMLVKNAPNRSLFTLTSDLYHKSFIWKLAEDDGTFKIYTLPDTFSFTWQTMYFHRGFPFIQSFNRHIHYIKAGGLIQKHINDLQFNERKKYRFHEKPKIEPMSLNDLREAFLILLAGCSLSTAVFIYEYMKKFS